MRCSEEDACRLSNGILTARRGVLKKIHKEKERHAFLQQNVMARALSLPRLREMPSHHSAERPGKGFLEMRSRLYPSPQDFTSQEAEPLLLTREIFLDKAGRHGISD
jgi:hypothetical protein